MGNQATEEKNFKFCVMYLIRLFSILTGKRIWKYDPQEFAEEECEEEEEESVGHKQHGEQDSHAHGEQDSHAHGEHESHGHEEHGHDDDHGKTQMFYHLITFK